MRVHVAGSSPRVRGTRCAARSAANWTTVHPRVCGELSWTPVAGADSYGSSPRVRGTPFPRCYAHNTQRFIPAYAGNSARRWRGCCCASVHPRVCGELRDPPGNTHSSAGSSPRVRGTRTSARLTSSRPTVHPRVCGELSWGVGADRSVVGSSPRVRGTRHPHRSWQQAHRFIPACAGNSTTASTSRIPSAVHPRVCGELPVHHRHARRRVRFIPACAGNSVNARSSWAVLTVHPRVCGELSETASPYLAPAGSSPRVRGTRGGHVLIRRQFRFIPACAGNSNAGRRVGQRIAVHPRVCGELLAHDRDDPDYDGSSPRVRGTRACCPPPAR